MQFNTRFLNHLRSRLSISEIVGQKVKLIKKGKEYLGLCPFHHEKTPSFTVNEEKEFYHCFGCGAHGDAIRFLVEAQHYTFSEAVIELAQRSGLPLPSQDDLSEQKKEEENKEPLKNALQEATQYFHKNLFSMKNTRALNYIERRGISPKILKTFCLGFASDDFHGLEKWMNDKGYSNDTLLKAGLLSKKDENSKPHDRFRNRVIFPIHNHQGQVVGFGGRLIDKGEPKYLNSPETIMFSKGKLLYGYYFAKNKSKSTPVIIVEGYMDALSLQQAGYPGAVAPLGTALTEDQILLAWRLCPEPILCFDGDAAGLKAATRAAERVLPLLKPGFSLRFCILPEGEDPDSLVQKGNAFDHYIQNPTSLVDMLWQILTNGQSFKTPEQKAALQKHYSAWAETIKSPEIKKSYLYAFKDLFFKTIVQKKGAPTPKSPNKIRKINLLNIHERLLLAILINHPKIIDEASDDLTLIDFKERSLHQVRECILEFYSHAQANDVSLKDYLLGADLKDELEDILSPNVLIHGSFAEPSASYDEALKGWKDIICRFNQEHARADVKIAQDDLASNMSTESWNRLKMLKLSTLKQD